MLVCTVYAMFALYSYCGQKLLYADFANKIYHIIISLQCSFKHNKMLALMYTTILVSCSCSKLKLYSEDYCVDHSATVAHHGASKFSIGIMCMLYAKYVQSHRRQD